MLINTFSPKRDETQLIHLLSTELQEWLCTQDPTRAHLFRAVRVIECSDYSRTVNKQLVYLVMKNTAGELYDLAVLRRVLMHEAVHLLQDHFNPGHDESFTRLEESLLSIYHLHIDMPEDYPCVA